MCRATSIVDNTSRVRMRRLSMRTATISTLSSNYIALCPDEDKVLIMSVRILAAALLLILGVINARAKEWRGIVPLKSTRADVERLIRQRE